MAESVPYVELNFKWMWCARHLESFRATWPHHGALAMLNLFQASASDDRIVAAAGGDTQRLAPVLREHGPMCCFLPSAVTDAVIAASLAGRKWEPANDSSPTGEAVA